MALTKITGQVINDTTGLVVGVTTVGGGVSAVDGFFSGILTATGNASFSGNVSVGGTLTYEDVTNIDAVGIITARSNILVGSGITLSPDGDIFFTGIMTGNGSGLTGVANTDVIFTDKISLPDSSVGSINVGLGSDLQVYHTGTHSFIENKVGNLRFKNDGTYKGAQFEVDLIDFNTSDNSVVHMRKEPKGNINITKNLNVVGTVTATSYSGDGSSLTGISVGIATEAASISGITTYLDLTKDDHELVVTGNNTISVIGGAQGTSHSLRIQNSGIATVTLDSTYFKFPSSAAPSLPTADGSISMISFTVHKAGAVGVNTILLAGASVSFG